MQPLHFAHPVYRRNIATWRFLRDAYVGGDYWYTAGQTHEVGPFTPYSTSDKLQVPTYNLVETNRLWRHEREKEVKYQRRMRASVYLNFLKANVDTVASIVASAIDVEKLPDALQHLEDDCDRKGTSLQGMIRQLAIWSIVHGHTHVLWDLPDPEGPMPSLYHERQAGVLPYLCPVSVCDMVDWRYNAITRAYDWVEVQELQPLQREPHAEPNEMQPRITRVFDTDGWVRYADGAPMDGEVQAYKYGFVPLVTLFSQPDHASAEPIGVSPMRDAAELALLTFNMLSWKTDEEQQHCFNQLVLNTKDDITPEMDVALGTSTYVAAEGAQYLAPDTKTMEHMDLGIAEHAARMRQMIGIETKGEGSQAAKSGTALQLERENMDAILSGYLTHLVSGVKAMLRMGALIVGANPDEVEVGTRPVFSQMAAAAQFDTMLRAMNEGGMQGVARAELQKQVFLAAHPDPEPDLIAEVFGNIDSGAARADQSEQMAHEQRRVALEQMAGTQPPEDEDTAATDVPDEPAMDATPEPTAAMDTSTQPDVVANAGGAEKAQDVALNGAQVTALVELVKSVVAGELPRDSAVAIIAAAFPLSRQQAEELIGEAGTPAFEKPAPEPPPFGFGGPPKPDAPPDEDDGDAEAMGANGRA